MTSYSGRHAHYYDIFYRDKPYTHEAAVVHDCLKQYSQGPCKVLLELACGSGRHAFELEKMGYHIIATDYSPDLLEVARIKAKAKESRVDFRLQDMREISVDERPVDAAYCLFDSIGYLQTNAAIHLVFQRLRDHVRENGLFILEFWHAAAMLRSYEPVRVRRFPTDPGEITRISRTHLDVERQLARVSYFIDESDGHGSSIHTEETQVNRYFLVQEMSAFLEHGGFQPLEFSTAYTREPVNEDTWHILAVARRGRG